MNDLKTLKDFDDMGDIILNIKNLKAEAVKWARMMKNRSFFDKMPTTKDWVLHFFNLTEEDLK